MVTINEGARHITPPQLLLATEEYEAKEETEDML